MTLNGDDITEASLLKPTEGEHGASPTPEEEAVPLGEEPESLETPMATYLLECPEIPEPPEPSVWIDAQLAESTEQTYALTTSSPNSNPPTTLPGRQRNPRERLGLPQSKWVSRSIPTCRRMKGCQNGGGSSNIFFTLRMSSLVMSKSKGWPDSKLQPSGCHPHSRKKWLVVHSALSECVAVKRLYSPEWVPGNLRLLRGAAWQNDGTGHGPPEVHCSFQNAPRDALWSRKELCSCLDPNLIWEIY